ncbi:MAG: M36 family metallopeptidase [Bacteroidota bacterium]|nr:M36 family metallopeptidase [Bacteroidota bacterium]
MRALYTAQMRHCVVLMLLLPLSAFVTAQKQHLPPKEKASALLRKNIIATGLSQSNLADYRVTDAYADKKTGSFLVYLQQTHLGIPVYNKIGIYVFKNDLLVQKQPDYVGQIPDAAYTRTAGYSISPAQAVHFAANHVGVPVKGEPSLLRKDELSKHFVYTPAGMNLDSITTDLYWLPVNDNKDLRLCWNVRIASPDKNNDWFVRVDAQTGEYLEKNSLIVAERADADCLVSEPTTAAGMQLSAYSTPLQNSKNTFAPPPATGSASYRVYPLPVESPNFGSQSLETDPWLKAGTGNNATTLGWHNDGTTDYAQTRGNNVWAQEDIAGTNLPGGFTDNSSTTGSILTFDNTINPILNPVVGVNLKAGIDNLFYWNNLMHDISYQYGFDEAAGNFQTSNLGRGGSGNDYVWAFAASGVGMNNADFSTPTDGQNPRMRMFYWNLGVSSSLTVTNPAGIAASYAAVENAINYTCQLANFGSARSGNIVLLNDPSGSTHLGCGTIQNAAALTGNIALIDRGTCSFDVKIKAAQDAGAIGVIVINNSAAAPVVMGGSTPSIDQLITIPSIMISQTDGNTLKANLAGLSGSMNESGLFRDGSLDNGIIAHEYTHGISNRLTGGPANIGCLSNAEQMGEGWSDYLALMVTTNWATAQITDGVKPRPIGTYAFSQAANGTGIRKFPYSTDMSINSWTYGMMAGIVNGEVHSTGEIWCATIWDMTWNIIQQEGISPDIYHGTKGNNIALQLVMLGMKLQPCSPGFIDARDAILKADSILYNNAHKCAIWNAFARRGMGKSASQGSSSSTVDQTQAFDLPAGMGVANRVNKTTIVNGDNISYTIQAYCDCAPLSGISITDTLATNLNYTGSSGGTFTAPYVHFDNINFAAGETKTFTIQATAAMKFTPPVVLINDSRDPAGYTWTSTASTGSTNWVESTARSHSSSHAWFAQDRGTATNFTLTSGPLLIDSIATLSFWHYFETQPAFDGGVIEISTDAGTTWNDLGPYITQNGYNASFHPNVGSPMANRPAFSGSTGGTFIQTIVSLTEFAGLTVQIRFRFASDPVTAGEGWYIDDILLQNQKGIVNKANVYNGSTLLSKSNTFSFITASALPVTFLQFEATKMNRAALLQWKVSDEINTSKYVVERSADGLSFYPIAEVAAVNSSRSVQTYSFTDDATLPGTNYYRIAEKDMDGKSVLSTIKSLRFTSADLSIRLMPVPTYNQLVQVNISGGTAALYKASILNTVGQLLKVYRLKPGNNLLDLHGITGGVYYLKVESSDGQSELRKIVIE